MTKLWTVWLFILYFGTILPISSPPQLTGIFTDTNYTANQLVKDFFIKGTCRNVAAIESFGDPASIGRFENGSTTIGFEDGIILSTGRIKDAEGPNKNPKTSTSFNANAGDTDLQKFASNVIFDATGIEFDFIPLGTEVSFQYVFASEEYCEFVGSIFNDLFGFFVSGPGIDGPFENGAINVAKLPGTDEFVTINTVNHGKNSSAYVQNELLLDTDRCGIPFNANYLDLIDFDGFTIPLVATIPVIPCETYHIRLVIGDVGDDKLDSAVFLESKSFNLGDVVTVRAEVEGAVDPIAFESCRDGQFVFERARIADISEPLEVNYTISPMSDAEEGLDFQPIPGMITIPADENEFILPIELIADNIDESTERLRLDIVYDCVCLDPVNADLYISDLDTMSTELKEIEVCAGQNFRVGPNVFGGAEPYRYEWDTGDKTEFISRSATEPRHYAVTVTDACADTLLSAVGVDLQPEPHASLSGDTSICFGEFALLNFELGGNAPWTIEYQDVEGSVFTVDNIQNSPFQLPIPETGIYEITGFQDAFCTGTFEGIAQVFSAAGEFEYEVKQPSCPGSANGQISFRILDGVEPFQVEWGVPVNDPLELTNLAAGLYIVEVTNGEDCKEVLEIVVPVQTEVTDDCNGFQFFIPNAITPNNDGVNDWFEMFIKKGHSIENIVSVRLVDRWGGLLFETLNTKPEEEILLWNVEENGEVIPPGVYFWQVQLKLLNQEMKNVSGTITVLR